MDNRREHVAVVAAPVLGVATVVGLWWATVAAMHTPAYLLPTPASVAAALAANPGYLAANGWATLLEVGAGFALAGAGGLAVGTALAASRWLELALTPVLVMANAVPKPAFAPLLVVWLGFGMTPKVIMVVSLCFLPVVLSTLAGMTSTDTDLVELGASLSASRWQMFAKIRFRAALPQIVVGLKTAMPLSVVGAVVGELFGADVGLGSAIQASGTDASMVFASMTVLAAMSIGLHYLVVAAERVLVPWARTSAH